MHRSAGDPSGDLARVPVREAALISRPNWGRTAEGDRLDMNPRNRLAALLAAGALVMALAAVASAGPPTYGISLTKSANPANVPVGGGTVVYTVAATATGTGFF